MLLLLAFMPVLVNAEPSSQVAWTPEVLNLVKNGNINKGKELAESCKGCHGDKGQGLKEEIRGAETLPAIPALAGQVANYTFKQLRDYFSGSRVHDSMTLIAKGLTVQEAADLASWFNTLSPPQNQADDRNFDRAKKMIEQGDGKRLLPPCFVCHGTKGKGEKMDVPALAGQQADYLARTLTDYKNSRRHNDVYSRMRLIAEQLSDEEIRELAQYYQQLR
jgi:cytochrome c553